MSLVGTPTTARREFFYGGLRSKRRLPLSPKNYHYLAHNVISTQTKLIAIMEITETIAG